VFHFVFHIFIDDHFTHQLSLIQMSDDFFYGDNSVGVDAKIFFNFGNGGFI